MAVAQKYFSFAEIVQGRDASVRVTQDGLLYAVDLVMVVTGKNRDDAGKALRRLTDDIFQSDKMSERPSDNGGHPTKLLTFQNALELVMVLPGRIAKETRTQFAGIIQRYLAGDHTLISEVQANAASSSPVAQMARASLGIHTDEDMQRKRRRQDAEIVTAQQQGILTFMDAMDRLDPDWKKDTRLVMQTKDHLKNVTLGPRAVTSGGAEDEPIYICDLARKMGFGKLSHGDCCKIGKKAAQLFRDRHGKPPAQRKQFVDGAERQVAAYTEADRDILETAVRFSCFRVGRGGSMVIVEFLDEHGNKVDQKQGNNFEQHYVKRAGKGYDMSVDTLKKINQENNDYWSYLLNKEIDFEIGEIDVAYVTASDTGLIRNQYLSSLFLNPPVVVDAYAGVGMDSISFLYNLYWKDGHTLKRLYVVENGGEEEKERNDRLISNVQKFVAARDMQTEGLVEFCLWGTENFFKECKNFKKNPVNSIDLLYLDPPWTVPGRKNSGVEGEATPQELMDYIYDTILRVLIDQKIHVRVVCIKTRFEWREVSNIIELLREKIKDPKKQFVHHSTIKCVPFKNVYYFHSICTMEPEVGEWEPTAVFEKAYERLRRIRNGKNTRFVNNRRQYERDLVLLDPQRRRDLTAIVGALHERISQLELQEANANI